MLEQISTNELLLSIDNFNVKTIDIRSVDAYNGWRGQRESRGGHVKGAKSLPAKWSSYLDWIDIVLHKHILPADTLIIYGDDNVKIEQVANLFLRAGYPKVRVYREFASEWSKHEDYPMEKLEKYRYLVSPKWVNQLIKTDVAPEYDNNRYVICHAHYRNRSAYESGHIPGSVDLDTNLLESQLTWNRHSPEILKEELEKLGIAHDTTVILYGKDSEPRPNDPFPGSSAGQLGAFRCAFIMMYAGVTDVRLLNGGLQSWIDEGFETTIEETAKHPVSDFGMKIPAFPEFAVDLDEAKEILEAGDRNLVCVRSWDEYIGKVSGYNYIQKKGRIPGAVFANCGSDAYHMENYRNLDGTTREFHEIEAIWAESGITRDKHNAFYCGTGWRGSEAFFNAWLMGWPRVSVFDGGWFEWSNNDYAFETGIPEDKQVLKR
jgi:3-mercaptopyruvate sulfurtransferase SseA